MSSQRAAVSTAARQLLLLLLLTLPVWVPLTRPGLPTWQVGPLPVLNLHAIERGEPPNVATTPDRWRSDGSFIYTIARSARILGADAITAMKWSMTLAALVLALAMFGWGTRVGGYGAGLLSATLAIYVPVLLSTLYRSGDLTAIWVAAGVAITGYGLNQDKRWGLVAVGLGTLLATASAPGLGLWVVAALLAMSLLRRQWIGAGFLLAGGLLGVLVNAPWSRPVAAGSQTSGVLLHQLIEPGWLWDVNTLGRDSEPIISLGLALLALLILSAWALFVDTDAKVNDPKTDYEEVSFRSLWLATLLPGLLLVIASLDFIASRVALIQATVDTPWLLLLIAVPFLAVAAGAVLDIMPGLRQTPLWAALIILAVLNAGPALSPTFETHDVPTYVTATFGDNQVHLLRLEPEGTLEPGTTTQLRAEWMALTPPDFDFNIFLHVVDAAGNTVTQLDVQPQDGARPLTSWQPGEIIPDTYELTIPAEASSDLHLRLGLYNWQTLDRLGTGDTDAYELAY